MEVCSGTAQEANNQGKGRCQEAARGNMGHPGDAPVGGETEKGDLGPTGKGTNVGASLRQMGLQNLAMAVRAILASKQSAGLACHLTRPRKHDWLHCGHWWDNFPE